MATRRAVPRSNRKDFRIEANCCYRSVDQLGAMAPAILGRRPELSAPRDMYVLDQRRHVGDNHMHLLITTHLRLGRLVPAPAGTVPTNPFQEVTYGSR